jgi:methylamine---corrinoid protein Co-methyltransferase
MSKPEILDILQRTQTGEYCTVKDWDIRRIPAAIKQKLKAYGLEKTCDPSNPVNSDDSLADAFYKAGYEVALELGMLCETTERIVKVSEEELAAAVELAPSEILVGEGSDGTWLRARKPEDPYPMVFGASMAITFSEETWPLITEGIARERAVDLLEGPSLVTVQGQEVPSGTPFETLVGYKHARMNRQIRDKVGRPGMGAIGCTSSVTEYGQLASYGVPGGFRPSDLSLVLFPSEMKVNYTVLHKVVHTLNMGGYIFAGSPSMIGGMSGPPEGSTLSAIACAMLQYAVLQAHAGGGEIYDIRYLTNVNRQGLWALSVTHQALSRNTHLLTHAIANEVSGPVTENLLLETLVGVSTLAASGTAIAAGPRPAGGKLAEHLTPLECRFAAEVAHKASGLSRRKVNEIAKEILPRFEGRIKTPDVGRSFREAYDLKTLQPSREWEDIYRKVKAEAIALGIPLDPG